MTLRDIVRKQLVGKTLISTSVHSSDHRCLGHTIIDTGVESVLFDESGAIVLLIDTSNGGTIIIQDEEEIEYE